LFGNVSTEKSRQTTSIYIYNHICITNANRGIHLSQHIYLSFAGRKGNTLGFDPKGPFFEGPLGAGQVTSIHFAGAHIPSISTLRPTNARLGPESWRYLKWPSIFIGTYRNHDIVVIPAKSPWNVWGAPIFLAVDGHPQRASPFVGS